MSLMDLDGIPSWVAKDEIPMWRIDRWRAKQLVASGAYPTEHELREKWGDEQVDQWITKEAECEARRKEEAGKAEQQAVAVRADLERRELARLRYDAEVPAKFAAVRFADLDRIRQPEAIAACETYAAGGEIEGHTSLLLSGPPGTGKTTLMACILNALLDRRRPVRFANLTRFLQRVRERQGKGVSPDFTIEGPESVLDLTEGYVVVGIDDLGRQRLTDWGAEQVYALVDTLYANSRRVILTTNVSTAQLESVLDEAILSRIHEMCHRIVLAGEDLRRA